MAMHLFLSEPDISYVPPIANMTKKNNKIIIVSLSSGIAPNRAYMSTLSPLMDEMVFKGRITRNTLSPERSTDDEEMSC